MKPIRNKNVWRGGGEGRRARKAGLTFDILAFICRMNKNERVSKGYNIRKKTDQQKKKKKKKKETKIKFYMMKKTTIKNSSSCSSSNCRFIKTLLRIELYYQLWNVSIFAKINRKYHSNYGYIGKNNLR